MRKVLLIPAIIAATLATHSAAAAEEIKIPAVFAHAVHYRDGEMVLVDGDKVHPLRPERPRYTLESMENGIEGSKKGLVFHLGVAEGTLYYGLVDFSEGLHPQPVYFKHPARIKDGRAEIPISALHGKYDMTGWEQSGRGTLGYRVVSEKGEILYDGRVSFLKEADGFRPGLTFLEGPTVHNLGADGAVIAFETDRPSSAVVKAGGRSFPSPTPARHHEVRLTGLQPDTRYPYSVEVSASVEGQPEPLTNARSFALHTAPRPGSRTPFAFAYASDSRAGQGGGERNIHGTNGYIMKKLAALAQARGAVFLQFTGDMINGRFNNLAETRLQYRNWKRVIEPFAHYLPVYATLGNHEGLFRTFDDGSGIGINLDRFPFATESAEAQFADQFVMPENGPASEDGAAYDPDPQRPGDFPPYRETVFSYRYDNVAMVVLNSNYLFSRSFKYWFASKGKDGSPLGGGGLHGYLMDRQLEWLGHTLDRLEADPDIDFVFVSQHTPIFPNGGHRVDDMWYDGDNTARPQIAGKPVARGIIEQRDRYLELLLDHPKVVAVLTGDEHNYARMQLTPQSVIHPQGWDHPKPRIGRTLWQINNGAAGAPYYAQEKLPWSGDVDLFSTRNALVLFHVQGRELRLEVVDPDTLEQVDEARLR